MYWGYITGVKANLARLSVVSEILRDGADEVRDKCHSLVDIQLIWFYMASTSVECALLCSKCSKIVENTRL